MRLFALATLLFALGCTPDQPVALANLTGADALAGADLAVSPGADGQADLPSVIDVQDAADLQTDAWTDVVVDVPPDVAPDIPVNPCINKPCDDANPCTTDTCAAGQCLHAPVVDGIPCSDNNACTQPDFCNQGTCAGSLACDTHATCAPSSGCTCALGWFGSGWACQPWLSGISLNGTPLVGFADNVFAYAVQGSISVQTVTVMVDAPADVSLTVNGQALVSGVASAPVALNLGKNLLTIVATGPGGQATYTITVTRELGEQDAYVKASNTNTGDHFGSPMAISGDTLVVSAAYESSNATGINGNQADNSMLQSGAVYVFIRSGGVWSQQAYLKASNPGWQDYFGYSVAISGDTIVVGARFESSNATGINGDQTNDKAKMSGAAYVFVRSGTIWSQQAYLKASNTDKDDQFGWSVAISGDTVVVGAVGESSKASGVNGDQADNSLTLSGAAYVFVRTGSTWTQQSYLKASNPDASIAFGASVAISGSTIVVATPNEDSGATGVNGNQADTSMPGAGAAYVFVRVGATWSQQAYLKASNPDSGDGFGWAVALSDDTLVISSMLNGCSGKCGEASNATGVNGNQADNSMPGAGAAYVFVRAGTTWSQQAYLKASNTDASDSFGVSVAIAGDIIAIGAPWESSKATGINGNQADNSTPSAGAAYVFMRSGSSWSQTANLKASNTDADDGFGHSVAVSNDAVVVGATFWSNTSAKGGESSNATGINGNQADNSMPGAGAVYVFR